MLNIIISLQSEDLKVCELSTVVLDTSKSFFHLPVFSLDPKEQYPSIRVCKDSGTLFKYSKCTATQSKKVGWARVAGAETLASRICVCRALCRWTPAHLSWAVDHLGCAHTICLSQRIPGAAAQHLGNMDSPRDSSNSPAKYSTDQLEVHSVWNLSKKQSFVDGTACAFTVKE